MKKFLLILGILLTLTSTVYAYGPNGYDKSKFSAVYRVYNPITGEHLFTNIFGEAVNLESRHGWKIESVGWYSPVGESPVYRLYNPIVDEHLYTQDLNEINVLTSYNSGWLLDNNGYSCFWSGGDLPVYRLFSPVSRRHLLTADANEYNVLGSQGWSQEGIAFYGLKEPLY